MALDQVTSPSQDAGTASDSPRHLHHHGHHRHHLRGSHSRNLAEEQARQQRDATPGTGVSSSQSSDDPTVGKPPAEGPRHGRAVGALKHHHHHHRPEVRNDPATDSEIAADHRRDVSSNTYCDPKASDAVFDMRTGKLYIPAQDGHPARVVDAGSGLGADHNNADRVHDRNRGPIPPGRYEVGTPAVHNLHVHNRILPTLAMVLRPLGNVFHRNGFLIHQSHGYNGTNHSLQSNGCITVPPKVMHELAVLRKEGQIRGVYVTADASQDAKLGSQYSDMVASATAAKPQASQVAATTRTTSPGLAAPTA